jgi:hypothetical protein
MAAETLNRELAPGGGGNNEQPSREGEESSNPNRKDVAPQHALSDVYLVMYGTVKARHIGVVPPEQLEMVEAHSDTSFEAEKVALRTYSPSQDRQSHN